MKTWTWPIALIVIVLIAAIAIMFGAADDQATQQRLLDYFDTIVTFVVGAASGAAVGGTISFRAGIKVGKAGG